MGVRAGPRKIVRESGLLGKEICPLPWGSPLARWAGGGEGCLI